MMHVLHVASGGSVQLYTARRSHIWAVVRGEAVREGSLEEETDTLELGPKASHNLYWQGLEE